MKLEAVLIAWNPNSSQIEAGPWPDRTGWIRKYRMTSGACYTGRRELSEDRQRLLLFIDFNAIVVRDRVDPEAAHQAFLAIDEYRRLISPDQFGAEMN